MILRLFAGFGITVVVSWAVLGVCVLYDRWAYPDAMPGRGEPQTAGCDGLRVEPGIAQHAA